MISCCSSSARRAISGAVARRSRRRPSARGPRTDTTPGSSRRPSSSRSPLLAHAARKASSSITSSAALAAARHHRAAGERRAVVARGEDVREPRPDHQRADRQPAAEALGQRHRVRHDAESARRPTASPVRPIPRLDLVEHQRRADRVAGRADRRQQLGRRSGSRPTRPARARSAPRRCSRPRRRRPPRRRPPGTRAPAARTAPAWPPAASPTSAPYVRPWNALCATTTSPRGRALRTSLIAASLASAPELQKNTTPPNERAHKPRGQRARSARCRRGSRRGSAARPAPARPRTTARMAVAEVVDRDPAQEVEVLDALGVRRARSPSRRRTRRRSARRSEQSVMTRASPSCRCRRP